VFTFAIIFLLLIVAGWLDSRLDWKQQHEQEKTQ